MKQVKGWEWFQRNNPPPDYNYQGGFWYITDWNRFTDVDGVIVDNIMAYFEPWVIDEWIKYCEETGSTFRKVTDRWGHSVEFFYMDEIHNLDNLIEINTHRNCLPPEEYEWFYEKYIAQEDENGQPF